MGGPPPKHGLIIQKAFSWTLWGICSLRIRATIASGEWRASRHRPPWGGCFCACRYHTPTVVTTSSPKNGARDIDPADDGSALFRRGIAVLESLLNAIIPEKTALLQNYPNPFNPETWIPYQFSEASEVTITIYDALGRVIKQLDLGYQPAGLYRTRPRAAHWDGRNEVGESVASGVYFVQLKTKGYQQTRRIILLK